MRISDTDKIIFTKDISVMIRSGIPLGTAIASEAKQAKNPDFGAILTDVAAQVEAGGKFSTALEKYRSVFGYFYIQIIKAGEKSGSLEKNTEYLFEQISARRAFKRELRSALTYPAVIISAVIVIGFVLARVTLPTIRDLLLSFNADPPFFTKVILAVAYTFEHHIILVIFILLSISILFFLFLQTIQGKRILNKVLISMPILGPIFTKVYLVRFSKVFSTLLKSGVAVHESLEIAADSMENSVFRNSVKRMIPFILKGQTISDFLDKRLFPPLYIQMIEVGERSAHIEQHLDYLADFYQKEVEYSLKNILTLIEPVLLLVIGVVVLFLALAILSPMYQIIGGA